VGVTVRWGQRFRSGLSATSPWGVRAKGLRATLRGSSPVQAVLHPDHLRDLSPRGQDQLQPGGGEGEVHLGQGLGQEEAGEGN
jgi:hypothetical protein